MSLEFTDIVVRQQPDDVTCGPTCLQAVYGYFGLDLTLRDVIESVSTVENGGTLGVLLGIDALDRGFDATLYTLNLDVFDPSWFSEPGRDLREALLLQRAYRSDERLHEITDAYVDFLDRGGEIHHEVLTPDVLADMIATGSPPITGLNATYLYGCKRELYRDQKSEYDDIRGEAIGHFVLISGHDPSTGAFRISDPSQDNPLHGSGTYWVDPNRLVGAILLGVTTYDGNLLVVRPRS